MEVKEQFIQEALNKYNYNITANGLECVEPIDGAGGYFNFKLNETGIFDNDTQTILFNRYGVNGAISYKQLIDGISENQGLNNYLKC